MPLSVRNNFFKAGIFFAILSLCFVAVSGYLSFSAFPVAIATSAMRPQGTIQTLIEGFTEPIGYIPFWSMLGAAAYSLIGITLIYYFFEKTQSPEIFFIGFFVISLAFEFSRITIPLKEVFLFPAMYLVAALRVLLFGRYFGLFSLFTASICAAGLDPQRQQNISVLIVIASLVIALNVPVDSLVWDSAFLLRNSYRSMFFMVEIGILFVTVLTFFVSALTRGFRNYTFIGIGSFLAFAGRNILINSDNLITPIPGFVILAAGTWLICSQLRKVYLWL
jgi:hypothetical protein